MITPLCAWQVVFEHLGGLLAVLITLDRIIDHHATFLDHWTLYKRYVQAGMGELRFSL